MTAPASPSRRTGRRTLRTGAGVALLLAMACDEDLFCTPVLESEQGQVELLDAALVRGACRRFRDPGPLLVGTRWCPVLSCDAEQAGCVLDEATGRELDPGDVAACFDHQVQGAAWDEGCLVADAPGELRWDFVPVACPANALGYQPVPDALVLPVVELDELVAWLDAPSDAFVRRSLVGEDGEAFDATLQLAPGEVVHVLAGQPLELAAVLTHPTLGDVAWSPEQWSVRAEVGGASRAVELDPLGVVLVELAAGERMQLWLEREGASLPLGEVEGVASEALTRMRVVAGYTGDDGLGIPFGARAVTWAGDRIVYGVPVDWTVTEGVLPLWRDPERAWSPDYVALIDEEGRRCHRPPEKKTTEFVARLRATHGELQDEVTLRWSEDPEPSDSLGQEALDRLSGDGFERSPLCEGPGFAVEGCGCRGGGGGSGGPGALALVLLVLGRRRRAERRPSTSARSWSSR
ncbi:MAG: hypothetical protein KDK70_15460 [Myxococcales bacterium]|nr:hypothetical protein [Myxococcales bacterium]